MDILAQARNFTFILHLDIRLVDEMKLFGEVFFVCLKNEKSLANTRLFDECFKLNLSRLQ